MGVYIKGMEMPKNCDDCPLNYDSIDCMVADIALREKGGGDFLYEHERASKCPLVEIPPHGKCIDADALIAWFKEWYDLNADVEVWQMIQMLADEQVAPTIIPAEEAKE